MSAKFAKGVIHIIVPLVFVIVIGLIFLFYSQTKATTSSDIGSKAPDFTLTDFNGQTHSLSDQKGKPTVLIFWSSSCLSCLETLKYAQAQNQQSPNQIAYFAVHRSDLESTTRSKLIVQNLNITLPLLKDQTGETYKQYKFGEQLPMVFYIDKEGTIKERLSGNISEETFKTNVQKLLD